MPLAVAVAVSVVFTLVAVALFLWLFQKLQIRRTTKNHKSFRAEELEVPYSHDDKFKKLGKNVKAVIVDEGGVDALYLRKLEDGGFGNKFPKVVLNPNYEGNDEDEEEKRVDSEVIMVSDKFEPTTIASLKEVVKPNCHKPQPPPLPPLPPPRPAPLLSQVAAPPEKCPDPPQKPPPPPSQPLRPSVPKRRTSASQAPPPPPPPARVPHPKPPPAPRRKEIKNGGVRETMEDSSRSHATGPIKLKPLHWDKIISTNTEHSLVWDEIKDGSLRFDDGLMETLFAYTNGGDRRSQVNVFSSSMNPNSTPPSQVFILDPRKSQNSAIVLRSLGVSRKEIIDGLLEAEGLSIETLEKLNKMAPTHEEATKILEFNGNPTKLADAEAFLYHILKAVPSAFTRFKSMLFRLNYDSEILHLKETLQTMELGCKELRTRGLFLKLLEAILKAGNRMNAGTARGNAQGFNLTALGKIADIKSTDGKTTLLHFVVEQVVRSEGKRCSNARNPSFEGVEMEKEFLTLGLKQLGSLSNDFSNVKKAATIEYGSFINTSSSLSSCVIETRQLVISCGNGDQGGFLREMKEFLEGCEEELKVVREEQVRVMELVRRTTEYYQAGAFKDKGSQPLQLFVLVKGFLDMVDRVRVDITPKLQKKRTANVGQSSPPSPRFTGYTFGLGKGISGIGSSNDSESDDDF